MLAFVMNTAGSGYMCVEKAIQYINRISSRIKKFEHVCFFYEEYGVGGILLLLQLFHAKWTSIYGKHIASSISIFLFLNNKFILSSRTYR